MTVKDIKYADYKQPRSVWEELRILKLGEFHNLYVGIGTLLLAEVSRLLRNNCIEMYKLDPVHFLSTPGLAAEACLKKAKVKLELPTTNT